VAATGVGEHIVHTLLAVTVYRWLEQGAGLQEALDRGLTLIPESIDIGLIGMTLDEAAAAARPSMAFALLP
jgi:L-asparaginase/beta-aspartyl-peptidase (threonine type)